MISAIAEIVALLARLAKRALDEDEIVPTLSANSRLILARTVELAAELDALRRFEG